MQGYRNKLKKAFGGNNGSVLVGAVVISALMAIGVAGLMGVSRNTVSQEIEAHDDARAFLAAESGLMIGSQIFKTKGLSGFHPADSSITVTHDNITVKVSLKPADPTNSDEDHMRLVSSANYPGLPYFKELEWALKNNKPSSGDWGYFIDDPSTTPLRRTTVFDGPVHFNNSLLIPSSDVPTFRGNVTINNKKNYGNSNYGIGKNDYKNDYRKGMQGSNENKVMNGGLDNNFKKYTVNDNEYAMIFKDKPTGWGPANTIKTDDDNLEWHYLPIPNDASKSFLKFGIDGTNGGTVATVNNSNGTGTACNDCYTFFQQIANNQWVPHKRTIPPVTNGTELVIYADFDLTITDGRMSGIVSVATKDGSDINIDLTNSRTHNGSLAYNGYTLPSNPALPARDKWDTANKFSDAHSGSDKNYNLPKDNDDGYSNLLAFFSGRNIIIKPLSSTYSETSASLNSRCVITAQLLAPTGRLIQPTDNNGFKESINIFGAAVAKQWWAQTSGTKDEDALRVFHDSRQKNAPGVIVTGQGPGTPGSGDGSGKIDMSHWKETNRPR
ncbi:MAG: hypothetical protein FWB85_05605 [Chitinispirillia bacterium]|nr:hypothetical protein [Chitinispirillia bacterium]MCL2241700.1 hypothetical protein [Chitinispirillia bacterium]